MHTLTQPRNLTKRPRLRVVTAQVLFEGMDDVVGARVRKYLLEKSRVVRQVRLQPRA